jgi:hypothetical protein
MIERCAFCPSKAKISGEHLWSDWMNDLFPPADVVHFAKVDLGGSVSRQWEMPGLDMKANVVCKPCNETWMSDIENAAKVAMSDLILGRAMPEITSDQAQAISMFAFKTAVITDRMMAGEFFDISARYSFRTSRSVPPSVMMWLFGMHDLLVSGGTRSRNIYFPNQSRPDLALNVCSFFIGHFGFQVVSVISDTVQTIESKPVPVGLAIPFYPSIGPGVSWPRPIRLHVEAFDDFAARWDSIRYK